MKTIEIPGEVVAKGRPRFVRKTGRTYTPKKTRNYERLVQTYAKMHCQTPVEEPIKVTVEVVKQPPKSWSKKKKTAAINGEVLASVKPDIDNYCKAILDGMNGIAFDDDNQIVELNLIKKYGTEHKAIVGIEEIGGNE